MTSQPGGFFDRRREWSRRKHEVLEGYFLAFSRILGRDHDAVYLVDGFAGRGYYGHGADREDGSPLLTAKAAQRLTDAGDYTVRCINIEANRAEFEELVEVTQPYGDLVENLSGDFAQNVEGVLARIGTRPALFFLDPFGPGGLEWSTLERIGRRRADLKTELLINFNAPNVDRHGGWLDSFGQKPQPAFLRLLDRIFGCQEWRHLWDEPARPDERYRRITTFYLNRVHQQFQFGGASYPVRTVETEQLKYHLLFFTRHPLGLRIMNSIMYGVEQRYLKDRARLLERYGQQLDMFADPEPSIEEVEQQALEELQHDILTLGRAERSITFGRLQDRLLPKWFGRMVEKHFRRACASLIEQREIIRDNAIGIDDKTVLVFRRP